MGKFLSKLGQNTQKESSQSKTKRSKRTYTIEGVKTRGKERIEKVGEMFAHEAERSSYSGDEMTEEHGGSNRTYRTYTIDGVKTRNQSRVNTMGTFLTNLGKRQGRGQQNIEEGEYSEEEVGEDGQ